MVKPLSLISALLAAVIAAPPARAASYYVGPSGSGSTCSQASPCALSMGGSRAQAGDTVYLLGGTYRSALSPTNSGTASAWITFQAADGELPILDGAGSGATGAGSSRGTYIRFVGIVSRNWASGFANGWTGGGTTNSNGHIQFINCIADGNSANGIAFRSATGVLIQECIVAHNGSSTTASWSSGVDLFGAQGTPADNIVQRTVAFENVDMQMHTDGSGFIADDIGTGASFINNIGFRNGGSCIRLTTSTNTHIINNSCFHDGLDPSATGPSNPGEIFFSDPNTRIGVVMVNNLAVASGTGHDPTAIVNPPTATVSNNYSINSGATPFWVDPAAASPDFHLTTAAATNVTDKGTATNAPAEDIGFDPKCLNMTSPGGQSWWIYSVDYAYITSLGGVAKCFHPGARPQGSAPDIGAYEYGAAPGSGAGGASGGSSGGASGGTSGSAGASGTGGSSSTGGARGAAGITGGGGSVVVGGGGGGTMGGGSGGAIGAAGVPGVPSVPGTAGAPAGTAGTEGPIPGSSGTAGAPGITGPASGSCACETTGGGGRGGMLWLAFLASAMALRRRRRRREPVRK